MTGLVQLSADESPAPEARLGGDSEDRLWVCALELEQVVGAIIDPHFRLMSFTPAFHRHFASPCGRRPKVGEDVRVYSCQTTSGLSWADRWENALAGHRVMGVDELDGAGSAILHWRTQMQALHDEDGLIYAAVLSARDISREMLDLKRLTAARSELQHIRRHETIGKLATNVAHDLNNMLNVVGGSLELLGRETAIEENHRVRRHVALTFEALDRAANITKRLLSLGRRHEAKPARVDVQDLLAGMVDIVEATAPDGILVEWQIEPGLWHVRTSPIELENALLNLVLNACDAMPQGGDLILRAENFTQVTGEEYAMISVCDTGHGICAETITKIFDPFFTTKSASKGSGLGLTTVEEYVRGLGGHVAVDSAEKIGSIFRIMLPRDAA